VAGVRKHEYKQPVATMKAYLEAMDAAIYMGPKPKQPAPVVIGALRTKMLELSATKANGAHPYFTPPEHTARARKIIGKNALLCPEQMVLLEKDASKARASARGAMKIYCGLPNYQNNLKWLGFVDADFVDGGSDRLVDAIVSWGGEKVIAERIQAHLDAGADHVCIQTLVPEGARGPDEKLLEIFAPKKN
jgi:probable F420-dependent oxidoreductase